MIALLTFALLSSAAGASLADVHVHVDCKAGDADCPPPRPPRPPRPPAPPVPPAPPAPPALDAATADAPDGPATPALPAPPAAPMPPAPPAVPAPPPLPPVPDSAHADCASKKPGTRLSFTLPEGGTMSGVCERHDGKMMFALRAVRLHE